jgi:hypothetical protein
MTICCTELTGSEYVDGFMLFFAIQNFVWRFFSGSDTEVNIEAVKMNSFGIPV